MLCISKFGGTSLCDGDRFLKVRQLISEDSSRQGVVVSAPGKRFREDEKITDLLYAVSRLRHTDQPWQGAFDAVAERFRSIVRHTGAFVNIEAELDGCKSQIEKGAGEDYIVSRGEYFSALILSALLGFLFIDSASWLRFDAHGQVDTVRSYGLLRSLATRPFVTSGFYGAFHSGEIHTFSRGGSDITASLVAVALDADLCENWTDVDGVLMADPRLIPQAKPVAYLTYSELAELTAVGTQVLHEGAVRPLMQAEIPLHIKNSFCPQAHGTKIIAKPDAQIHRNTLLSLTGKEHQALICLRTDTQGLLGKILQEAGVQSPCIACAFGSETAIIPSDAMEGLMDQLTPFAGQILLQDRVSLLAAVVAREEEEGPLAADLLSVLKREKIPVYAMFRPFGAHTFLLAVPDIHYKKALLALYHAAQP